MNGPQPKSENSEEYITEAINLGYYVEIDLWFSDNKFFLGHDGPVYETSIDFLNSDKLFVHCKNGQALLKMLSYNLCCEFFWHQHDDYILTSKNNIWVEPGKPLLENSICCLPEQGYKGDLKSCYGICSDFITDYLPLLAPR